MKLKPTVVKILATVPESTYCWDDLPVEIQRRILAAQDIETIHHDVTRHLTERAFAAQRRR